MQHLTTATTTKLLPPVIYLGLTLVFVTQSWPDSVQAHHLIGAILAMVSLVVWIIARIQLGNAFTIAPDAKFIVKHGIYSKLRHPVYCFSIMAGLGLCVYVWQWPLVFVLVLFILLQLFRIHKEEAVLSKHFGQEYLDYKKSTWF